MSVKCGRGSGWPVTQGGHANTRRLLEIKLRNFLRCFEALLDRLMEDIIKTVPHHSV